MTTLTLFENEIQLIDKYLSDYLTVDVTDNRRYLAEAMRYSVSAKAKRIRPLLTIATYKLFESDITPIIPLACAIEMVHTYSLIHDDLPAMDDDDFRRGQLSCHKKYGEDIAILAGDTLHTYAIEIVARDLPNHFSAEKVLKVIQAMTVSFGLEGMAGGQVLDLKGTGQTSVNTISSETESYLIDTHHRKTGMVLQSCVVLPVILANSDPKILESLTQFGRHLGLLFQIVDDVLDVIGTKESLGKSPNKDEKQDKLTYVKQYGLEGATQKAETEFEAALAIVEGLKNKFDTSYLNEIIKLIIDQIKTKA